MNRARLNELRAGRHATIGILGGGQLGRMLALAAARLGFAPISTATEPTPGASRCRRAHTVAPTTTMRRWSASPRAVDVVTYEFENVPASGAIASWPPGAGAPGPGRWRITQDRLARRLPARLARRATAPFARSTAAATSPRRWRLGRPGRAEDPPRGL
jgi:5-(carboxyamino)imidazole ribonucleotide synthase